MTAALGENTIWLPLVLENALKVQPPLGQLRQCQTVMSTFSCISPSPLVTSCLLIFSGRVCGGVLFVRLISPYVKSLINWPLPLRVNRFVEKKTTGCVSSSRNKWSHPTIGIGINRFMTRGEFNICHRQRLFYVGSMSFSFRESYIWIHVGTFKVAVDDDTPRETELRASLSARLISAKLIFSLIGSKNFLCLPFTIPFKSCPLFIFCPNQEVLGGWSRYQDNSQNSAIRGFREEKKKTKAPPAGYLYALSPCCRYLACLETAPDSVERLRPAWPPVPAQCLLANCPPGRQVPLTNYPHRASADFCPLVDSFLNLVGSGLFGKAVCFSCLLCQIPTKFLRNPAVLHVY